jgi:predicted transcriptional regulator
MPVGSYCQQPVCTIDGKETAQAAAERMDKEGVGCVVVVQRGRPVGILCATSSTPARYEQARSRRARS